MMINPKYKVNCISLLIVSDDEWNSTYLIHSRNDDIEHHSADSKVLFSWCSRLGNRLACKRFAVQSPVSTQCSTYLLGELIKYVKIH